MAFHKPHRNYLSSGILHTELLRPSSSLPTVRISSEEEAAHDLELHKQRIEAELEEILATQTLSLSRRSSSSSSSKYLAVTIPSSVKHQVTESRSTNTMARPRSPQKKNDVDYEYIQGLLDDQLSVIRQQLNSLSSERAKMEQKMEDLTNGIKEVQELSACMPMQIIITSTPGNVRRAHSVEARKPHIIKTDSQQSLLKKTPQTYSSHRQDEVVDGNESVSQHYARERFTSMSSIGSDVNSADSMNSPSVFSYSSSLPKHSFSSAMREQSYRSASVSDYMEGHLSPTPIPELPESPQHSRPVTPRQVFVTHSPMARPRSNTSYSPVSVRPPKHHPPPQPSPSHLSLTPSLLSPTGNSRSRSGSFSLLASPRLALKATRSSQDVRGRSGSSPAPKRKSPPTPKIRHTPKDQRLSYFRNSLTDIHKEASLKDSQLSINTDDECELKGSSGTLSEFSGATADQDVVSATAKSSARILRRSSLTGQIEHVTNLRTQVHRNSSFNSSSPVEKLKHTSVKEQHSLSINQRHNSTSDKRGDLSTSSNSNRVVFLDSKETTV